MNQNMEAGQYGSVYSAPKKQKNPNIAIWICVGLLALVLLIGMLSVGFFLIVNTSSQVPDVVGLRMTDAVGAIEKSGYTYRTFNEESSSVPDGHIIRQSPSAGERLKKGEIVTMYVCEKEEIIPSSTTPPTPTPSQSQVIYLSAGTILVNRYPNSGIYVRAQASTNSAKVLYIAAGDTSVKLQYITSVGASDGTWYQVRLPNGSGGYVRADVVRVSTGYEGGTSSGSSGGSYLVNRFSTSGIYVRAQASTNAAQVAFIAAGDTSVKLTCLNSTTGADGYTWYYVRLPNGSYGYVRSDVVRWW